MTDRPTATELLAAVREFLERELLDHMAHHLDARTRFHTRVAAHALAIVERELAIGPELEAQERQRLLSLLGTDGTIDELNRRLATEIRDGTFDDRMTELVEHIRETLRAKLAITKPGYADGN